MSVRKIRSAFKKIILNSTTIWNHLKIFLLEESVSLGTNISIGKNVVIKTTDGGKVTVEDNVIIENNCYINATFGEIIIGKNSFIGAGTQLVAKESIILGENNLISAYSIIRDANHGIAKDRFINAQPHSIKKISIGDDVWLGAHTVVTAGSSIGQGVVVGANSLVNKTIEPCTVVGGVPARFIKDRV